MAKMGRPVIYDPNKPRRGHLLQLTDELWEALGRVAPNITEYIETELRKIPQVAEEMEHKE